MPRGIRNEAPLKLPEGVKLATWVPVILIPREAPSAAQRRMDGTHLANQRRQSIDPNAGKPLALRYQPCCDAHKAKMTLAALERPDRLISRCNQLAGQQGHAGLRPQEATLTWQKCEGEQACEDCLDALPKAERAEWERSRAA